MAIYYVYSGAGGSNNGSSWANAFTTLTTAFVTEVAGDTLYVAHDHVESIASAVTYTSSGTIANPTKVICVNRAGSVPPVSADRRATASVATTADWNFTLTGCTHYDGIIFSAGTGTSSSANLILLTASLTWLRFDNCSLRLGINFAGSGIYFGGSSGSLAGVSVELNNTTLSFAHANHATSIVGTLIWRNTSSALLGTMPATLLTISSLHGGMLECIGVDFSAAGSSTTLVGGAGNTQSANCTFIDCKLNASVVKSGIPVSPHGTDVDFHPLGFRGK